MRNVVAAGVCFAILYSIPFSAGVSAEPKTAIGKGLALEAKNHSNNMIAAAEIMPADKYSFKPSPAQASFADLIFHAADANYTLCSASVGDTKPEASVKATGAKDALVDQLKKSFAYCDGTFDRIDPDKLDTEVHMFGRTVSRAWVLFHMALDWGDHYSQVASILRLNGITPPSAQRRQ